MSTVPQHLSLQSSPAPGRDQRPISGSYSTHSGWDVTSLRFPLRSCSPPKPPIPATSFSSPEHCPPLLQPSFRFPPKLLGISSSASGPHTFRLLCPHSMLPGHPDHALPFLSHPLQGSVWPGSVKPVTPTMLTLNSALLPCLGSLHLFVLCPELGRPSMRPPHLLGVSAHLPLPGSPVSCRAWVSRTPCGVSITVVSGSLLMWSLEGRELILGLRRPQSWAQASSMASGVGWGGVDQKVPLGTCRLGGPGFPWDGGGREQVRSSIDRPQGYQVVWK